MTGFDVLGNIAILKFPERTSREKKKRTANNLMGAHKNITTVLEKKEKVSGRLRTLKTRFLAGEKSKEALYLESGCKFKLDIEKCYFSPRLSGERLEIASKIKRSDNVLVLFAGVAPFPVIIAKKTGARVTSVELGRVCCKYARENVKLNKLNNLRVIQGDVKKLNRLLDKSEKYEVIVMPRPQLKDTFLEYVWKFCKPKTRVYYYDFGKDVSDIVEKVESEARKARKKIKILGFKKAGDIAPYKFRFRVDFIILN